MICSICSIYLPNHVFMNEVMRNPNTIKRIRVKDVDKFAMTTINSKINKVSYTAIDRLDDDNDDVVFIIETC